MSVIDDYLKKIEPEKRSELERIRALVRKMVPESEETIYYMMPTLKYKGKGLIAFDAHKYHIGLYPCSGSTIEDAKTILKKENYEYSKGAIKIPLDKPISEDMLEKIVDIRKKEIDNLTK